MEGDGALWDKRHRNAAEMAPNFEEVEGVLAKEYWDDWIQVLMEQNKERLGKTDDGFMGYLTLESVEYIFTVCVRMRLPQDVRYLSALYFDAFMRKQSRSLFKFVADSCMNAEKKDQEWAKIEANLSRQVVLRICTCIQLASKELQYHTSLSAKDVVSMLRSLGHAYTLSAVIKSEIRVSKTLNFTFPMSPLAYPETLLKAIQRVSDRFEIEGRLNIQIIWDHVILLLDVFFLYHDKFTEELLKSVKPGHLYSSFPRSTIACLKSDYILLGAGLVVTAITVAHDGHVGQQIVDYISRVTFIPGQDIMEIIVVFHRIAQLKELKTTKKR